MLFSSHGAFLALWNDVDPERIAEYDRWHTFEHVPERVWAPGFLSGTRYLNTEGVGHRYFTLYEIGSLEDLASEQYRSLVDEPTEWSASMRPSLHGFLRKTGRFGFQAGVIAGGSLLVVRVVETAIAAGDDTPAAWAESLAEALAQQGAWSLGRVQIGAVTQAGPQALPNEDPAPSGREHLLLAQLTDPTAAQASTAEVVSLIQQRLDASAWLKAGIFQMLSRVEHADVHQPDRPRPMVRRIP